MCRARPDDPRNAPRPTRRRHHRRTFTVTSANDTGAGSLRDAIVSADTNGNAPAVDKIVFAIPGNGVHTISPTGVLPSLAEPVIVDGYTQGDATPGTPADDARPNDEPSGSTNAIIDIALDGTSAGAAFGLVVDAPNTVIRGIDIRHYSGAGVLVNQGVGTHIEGNFIGTDASGTATAANATGGIAINCPDGSGVLVGGTDPAARNVISGNTGSGIEFASSGCRRVTVQGNLIGTATDGVTALGNTIHGVLIRNASKSAITIGGAPGAGNVIANNALNGVDIEFGGSGTRVLSNSIFANGDLGIDLDNDGVTPNDHRDPDGGTNHLQNFPVITAASDSGTVADIRGTLDSRPNHRYLLQFFGLATNDPSSFGEGDRFFGQKIVTTNDAGKAAFHVTFTHPEPGAGYVTATATDLGTRDTSEFAQDVFIP